MAWWLPLATSAISVALPQLLNMAGKHYSSMGYRRYYGGYRRYRRRRYY